MHGRVQPEGGSCRSLRKTSSQHMQSVLALAIKENTVAVEGDHQSSLESSNTTTTTSDSFFKDGRKINVGDCALFKPPQDSPPFIGLIRCLILNKENNLQLGVNWLYRPAEIKLGKGTPVEGAPNEIFYSFHTDKIPAASLLHPCKVAFLPKGVGLPAGTASYVCRRVYDITNKCLWWLTDQDYINERQEEVDQLLHKTQVEMHAMLQPGGRSPKQVNGPTSTSQLKPASDSGQNSGTSSHSQGKGKKRERGDHGADPVKRERLRSDDGDSFQCKVESKLKSEIGQITERGGLVDLEGVEKLVQLMQPDRTERKMDLVSRSMLVGVMAATDKFDCLNRFVQLRGLPVLDEWLQDVHKGKIGDGNSSRVCEKSVEEFVLVLLRALDKLPINLHALQMCNIGRSVNHLRSHKNSEIQRKARSLVDMWKKGVEAEMISNDAKAGSTHGVSVWSSKSRYPDASHGGSRTPSGSDVALKSSITQNSTSKTTSARSSHGESNIKSASSSPGHMKPALSPSSGKESLPRISVEGTPDVPLVREDRSSSCNQSQGKEDRKSTIAGSMTVNKLSTSSSRSRKTSGFSGTSVTGSQKEISSTRSSTVHKSTTPEKSQTALNSERVFEGPITEGSSHKLIVKIPNRVRSPAQGIGGASTEDSTYMSSRVSSPVPLDKHEQFDHASEDKSDALRCNASDMNVGLWQKNDPKDVPTRTGEGVASPAALPVEDNNKTAEDSRSLSEGPSTNESNSGKLHTSSFSPMNALIESCVKYSEANTSLSLEDDVGMNLLASVAAGEMSRSDLVSPTDSMERSTPAVEEVCPGDEAKSKSSSENIIRGVKSESSNEADNDDKKQTVLNGCSWSEDGLCLPKQAPQEFSSDKTCAPCHTSADILAAEGNKHLDAASMDVKSSTDPKWEINTNSNEKTGAASLTLPITAGKVRHSELNEEIHEEKITFSNISSDGISNCKTTSETDVIVTEEKISVDQPGLNEDKPTVEGVASKQSYEGECKKEANDGLDTGSNSHQQPTSTIVNSEFGESTNNEKLQQTACGLKSVSEAGNEDKVREPDEKAAENCVSKCDGLNFDMEVDRSAGGDIHKAAGVFSVSNERMSHHIETHAENKGTLEHISVPERVCPGSVDHEVQQKTELKGSESANIQPDDAEEHASTCADVSSSAAGVSGADAKIKFDLNEVFGADEGKYGETVNLMSSAAATVRMINSLPFSLNSIPCGHSASITVAAAAKGPFVPPEDLLRSKGELGWKGSAATSAFRPAEPRKVLETSLGSTSTACPDASTSKQCRVPLDIDLNVPDERVLEEMASRDSALAVDSTTDFASEHAMLLSDVRSSMSVRSSGGLDLDLNRVDEASDHMNCSISRNHKNEGSIVHVKNVGGLPSGDVRRDFDLNDGPGFDDTTVDKFSTNQQVKGGIPPQLSSVGLRMNNPGQGSFSSWFPSGNTYPTIAIQSMLPDRGEHSFPVFPTSASQRTFGPSGVAPFTPDIYRGSVLSSSPAVPFPSSPFQFPVFPFGTTFPLPSATFSVGPSSYVDSSSAPRLFAPPVHSQLLGPIGSVASFSVSSVASPSVGSVASHFPRPYMVSLPDSSNNGGLENNRKWGRQGLDLNGGPGAMDNDVREERFPLSSGQHSVARSQALVEEHAANSVSSGIMKRKEPEGGWQNESFRFKQSSWQ